MIRVVVVDHFRRTVLRISGLLLVHISGSGQSFFRGVPCRDRRRGSCQFDNAVAQLIFTEMALVSQCLGSGYEVIKGLALCLAILHKMKPVYPELSADFKKIHSSFGSFSVLLC